MLSHSEFNGSGRSFMTPLYIRIQCIMIYDNMEDYSNYCLRLVYNYSIVHWNVIMLYIKKSNVRFVVAAVFNKKKQFRCIKPFIYTYT